MKSCSPLADMHRTVSSPSARGRISYTTSATGRQSPAESHAPVTKTLPSSTSPDGAAVPNAYGCRHGRSPGACLEALPLRSTCWESGVRCRSSAVRRSHTASLAFFRPVGSVLRDFAAGSSASSGVVEVFGGPVHADGVKGAAPAAHHLPASVETAGRDPDLQPPVVADDPIRSQAEAQLQIVV